MTIAAMQAVADVLAASGEGYDQGQRWSFLSAGKIVPGRETDCSAGCGAIAKLGGYPVDLADPFYTGNFAARLKAAGFTVLPFPGLPGVRPGDFVLTPGHHVVFARDAQRWWSAEFDEQGHATGGQAGNQTGRETRYRAPYLRPGGWSYIVRPPAEATTVSTKPTTALVPTLARVATFNCGAWGKTSMTAKQIDGIVGVLLTLNCSIYCLTECPEWLRDHLRDICKCPADAHRRLPGGATRWLVRERGSQAILRDSCKWASGPYDSDTFGPTDYHGWLYETLTQPTTKARLTVGCYHLPPNVVASQTFQRDGVRDFLAELPSGPRLVGGDGADDTAWLTGWADARTAAKASANRTAPTYGKAIRDRIHGKGIVVRRYTVIPSNGASDHNPVLAQITIPAGADPSL